MDDFHKGQRWISDSEPELGLGSVFSVTDRTVTVVFGASAARREYSRATAPLRRVRFSVGDAIEGLVVESVSERGGLLFYRAGDRELCESELSAEITFNKPHERLLAGQLDSPKLFDLRVAALEHQYRRRKSRVRGFIGGRIDLIPHQLYIASEVTGRLVPRVLLADEVGLGKTIEACLILHRLILTGRAQRVLILVPDSLVHQWFVELLRRFNLWFHIFDEERCAAIEASNPGDNPFLDGQFLLCSIRLFMANPERIQQASEAGWDMLVVDEAHHLAWSPEAVSPEYALIERLCRETPALLLLTATPEQLGMASHFARLHLLDPDRFYDLAEFVKEEEHYRDVARIADSLSGRREELDALLDRHGTGRVQFRNTRATIAGFPNRVAHMYPLGECKGVTRQFNLMLNWLAGLMRNLDTQKILLICQTQTKVAAIDVALRLRIKNVKMAVFHESLSLVQRDRNAAWFADDHGARILICSEIGSEGRNFQFAHHLVLLDLPLDPELLEQRIGRLDRIGQASEIQVHVPFIGGSSQEVLARWYHEGLNGFEENLRGGNELLARFGERLSELMEHFNGPALNRLIEETRSARAEIGERLHAGRDHLLELSSFRPDVATRIVNEIDQGDSDESLEAFMLAVFDEYGIAVEELAERTYRLGSAGVFADAFPGLPSGGFSVTCDRKRALAREDMQFLTWDHPLVTGALDLLLGSEKGNSSFAVSSGADLTGMIVETVYVLECIAPPQLHIDRFLPPTPLRVLVDHLGNPVKSADTLMNGDAGSLLEQPELREELLPRMIEQAAELSGHAAQRIVGKARRKMTSQLDYEITRLRELQKVNRSVREEEIDLLVQQRQDLDAHLAGARLRLDAIRLIKTNLSG